MNALEKIPGTKAVAIRIVNAENRFIANVQDLAGCTKEAAEKVLRVYRNLKIAKMDAVNGVISVKHGMYLDADILANAIALNE